VCLFSNIATALQKQHNNHKTSFTKMSMFKYTFFQLTCHACLHAFCEVKFFIALPSGYFLFLPKGQTGLAGDMKPLTAENIDRFLL